MINSNTKKYSVCLAVCCIQLCLILSLHTDYDYIVISTLALQNAMDLFYFKASTSMKLHYILTIIGIATLLAHNSKELIQISLWLVWENVLQFPSFIALLFYSQKMHYMYWFTSLCSAWNMVIKSTLSMIIIVSLYKTEYFFLMFVMVIILILQIMAAFNLYKLSLKQKMLYK